MWKRFSAPPSSRSPQATIATLNRKVRDRSPESLLDVPKKDSPPRPGALKQIVPAQRWPQPRVRRLA